MGVKFGVADSNNLISAMHNNLTTVGSIIDRLQSGAQHLIAQLDAGVLQGAAYTAGRGLFGELIVPGITKLSEAVNDVRAELASYEHAHSIVAGEGDLDHDDLKRGLQAAQDQLLIVEEQIRQNNLFFTQMQALFAGDLSSFMYQTQTLEQLKVEIEHEISQYKTKIEKLEWFVADVSNYFADSLQVMQLAARAAMELQKLAVEVDGSYYTNGLDLALIKSLASARVVTNEGLIETMMGLYGFTAEEAAIVVLAQKLFVKSDLYEDEHEFLAMMASLCHSYRAKRWTITAGNVSLDEAKSYFLKMGLSPKDVEALVAAVDQQHSAATNSGKKDFAHEMVGLAIFTFPRGMTTAGVMDFIMSGQLNEFSSYKGDAASGRFAKDDLQSDTDMINIYHRSLKPGGSVLRSMESYNNELVHGDTNRAQELVNSLGGGDFEELKRVLTEEILSSNLGDEYMSGLPHILQGLGGSGLYAQSPKEAELYAKQIENYERKKQDGLDAYLNFLEGELSK